MIELRDLSARRPPLALARVTCSLEAGVHALLGAPTEGGPLVLAVLAGRERVRGGAARVLDRPVGDPATARAIAYVPQSPALPDALTVRETLAIAAAIRGDVIAPDERLGALGIEATASRRVRSLAPEEKRAVAIAEALTSTVASVLLLDEPLVGVDPRAAARVPALIAARARDGACVVVATASPEDAAAIARSVHVFSRGALVRHDAAPHAVAALTGRPARLRAVATDAGALLAALATEPAAADLERHDGAIVVRGDDPAEIAAAIARAAVRAGVDLVELRLELPPVEELQAAATGAAAAAYQSALVRGAPPRSVAR